MRLIDADALLIKYDLERDRPDRTRQMIERSPTITEEPVIRDFLHTLARQQRKICADRDRSGRYSCDECVFQIIDCTSLEYFDAKAEQVIEIYKAIKAFEVRHETEV